MSCEELQTGAVISYPFLWLREAEKGETEGRKPRPTAVALRLVRIDGDVVVLLPITTRPPTKDRAAVEVPDTEKQRAGLEIAMRCWIILDEFNTDIIGKSFYLEPEGQLGAFSRAFFLPVAKAFIANIGKAQKIPRR